MRTDKQLLADANYIINQLCMGFDASERLLTASFERVEENGHTDMIRLFLPHYLHKDAQKFRENYSAWQWRQQIKRD